MKFEKRGPAQVPCDHVFEVVEKKSTTLWIKRTQRRVPAWRMKLRCKKCGLYRKVTKQKK